jgi:hypothetical protein
MLQQSTPTPRRQSVAPNTAPGFPRAQAGLSRPGYRLPCLAVFFKRILNFSQEAIAKKEKRQAERYAVGQAFPVKAVLSITGRAGGGSTAPTIAKTSVDWGGWMLNLSSTGASMQLHPAAITARGERCRFKLTFDGHLLEIDGQVAHFRSHPNYTVCGISLDFPDAETQKAYLQLLEPIVVGASFKAVDPKRVKQDTPDMKKEQYKGDSDTRLTVWRGTDGSSIIGFEVVIGPYSVTGSVHSPELDVDGAEGATHEAELSAAAREEIRRLFRWIVPNLAKAVPADVRRFLGKF